MRVMVTGVSGWLAGTFAEAAATELPAVELVGISRADVCGDAWSKRLGNEEYLRFFHHEPDDVVLHCAFCRRSVGDGLVESLEWSSRVFAKAMAEGVRGVVNVSSQGVYGGDLESRVESAALDSCYMYALAKASSEVLLEGMVEASGFCGEAHEPEACLPYGCEPWQVPRQRSQEVRRASAPR